MPTIKASQIRNAANLGLAVPPQPGEWKRIRGKSGYYLASDPSVTTSGRRILNAQRGINTERSNKLKKEIESIAHHKPAKVLDEHNWIIVEFHDYNEAIEAMRELAEHYHNKALFLFYAKGIDGRYSFATPEFYCLMPTTFGDEIEEGITDEIEENISEVAQISMYRIEYRILK